MAKEERLSTPQIYARRAGRLCRDRRGGVLIMFGLMSVLLVLVAGAGVDMALALQFRGALQGAADAAALAGATVYADAAASSPGRAVATNFMNARIPSLPSNTGVTFAATPFPTISGGVATAYNIKVTARSRVKTTFMVLAIDSVSVSVVAVATNPVVAGNGVHDDSYGDNYSIPADESLPAFDGPYDSSRDLELEAFGKEAGSVHLTQ